MTKQINYITLKIDLTSTTITVSIINKQKQEHFIELIPGIKQYPLNIEFNNNEIIVCRQQSDLLQELFTHPEQFNKHQIQFQNKTFQLLPESLLVFIISKFKKIIE